MRHDRGRAERWWTLLDAVVIAALIVVSAGAFRLVYGGSGWLVAAIAGALLGALATWMVLAVFRAHWLVLTAVVVIGYFLIGPAVATPDYTTATVIPSIDSLRLLALGIVTSWRQMLTVAVPIGSSGGLLIPVFLSVLVLTTVGAAVAVRGGRLRLWALAPPAVMMGVAATLGTRYPSWPLISGGTLAVGGLFWASLLRRREGLGGIDLRRPISALVVVAAAGAAMVYLAPAAAPAADRLAVRDLVVPPFDPQSYPSPLSGFRALVQNKAARDKQLFQVSGLPSESRIRLAAMDIYNGVQFNVSDSTGTFGRVGGVIDNPGGGAASTVSVTVEGYAGVYLPQAGRLTGIDFAGARANELTDDFRYATGSEVGVVTSAVRQGDRYTFTAVLPTDPNDEAIKAVTVDSTTGLQMPTRIPDQARAQATKATEGLDTSGAKILAVRDLIRSTGLLTHGDDEKLGTSPSGHGLDRIVRLLRDKTWLGDQEQFAPTLSLMLWSLGIPNRVVMGFAPTATHDSGPFQVTGADATAWVEVPTTGNGWIVVDPTPNNQTKPPEAVQKAQAQPKPQVLQPPPPPPPPVQAKSSDTDQSQNTDQEPPKAPQQHSSVVGLVLAIGLAVGIPLLLIGGPIVVLLWLKSRRRKRRLTADRPVDRVSGAWNQLLDAAADHGQPIPTGATRSEAAVTLDQRFGTGTVAIARRADSEVFAPGGVDDRTVAQVWAAVDEAAKGFGAGRNLFRRTLSRLSTRSLRRKEQTR